jgi:hypothetical protein
MDNKKVVCSECGSDNVVKRGTQGHLLKTIPCEAWPPELVKAKKLPKRVLVQRFECKNKGCHKVFIPGGLDTVIVLE